MNVYKEIYESNLTKILLFKSNSFSSDSVTFFFPMQISINILNSVHGEPLQNKNIYTHVAYIWYQEKRKSNSHWLKQKRSLLVHISKRSIIRADFRSNLIQMFQISSGLQFRFPLIFFGGVGTALRLAPFVLEKLVAASSNVNLHTTLSSKKVSSFSCS